MGTTKKHIHTRKLNDLSKFFKALAHPARLAIIELLLENKRMNGTQLKTHIELSQSTIAEHLRVLVDSSILFVNVESNETYYHVQKIAMKQLPLYTNFLVNKVDEGYQSNFILYGKIEPNLVYFNTQN